MSKVQILPGYRYTKAQLREAMTQEVADKLRFKGYYLEVDNLGYYSLVHHSQSFSGRGAQLLDKSKDGELVVNERYGGKAHFEAPDAIQKRTPEQRLNSLVSKMWPEVKDAGHIPGIKDEDILPIVANLKLRTQRMTGETVRAVAAKYLADAEKKHEEKLAGQITRHED